MNTLSRSRLETRKIAAVLAKEILSKVLRLKSALVLALSGDLGAGKTTFIQSFIKTCGVKKRITSPTFLLIRSYKLKAKSYKLIYHIDAYRIKKPKELLDLGLQEILNNNKNIVLIEWPEKIRKFLPRQTIWIKFKHGEKENERILNCKAFVTRP